LLFSSFGAVMMSLSLSEGDARAPLHALTAYGVVTVAVGAATANWLGPVGAGLAALAGVVVFCVVMARNTEPEALSGIQTVASATVIAGCAALCGRLATGATDTTALLEAVAASSVAWVILAGALLRRDLTQLVRLSAGTLRRSRDG
jgi:hypothetical protein